LIYILFCSSPGSPSLSGTGTVTVLVDDVNDNVPVFTASSFHTTVMENAPTGADVLLVNSSDADVGVNGVTRYPPPHTHTRSMLYDLLFGILNLLFFRECLSVPLRTNSLNILSLVFLNIRPEFKKF